MDFATLTYNPQDFVELQNIVREQGLFKRSALGNVWRIGRTLAIILAGLAFLWFFGSNIWAAIAGALYMAFAFGQTGLIFHDAGHRQMFGNDRWNDVVGHLCGLFLGASLHAWMNTHNAHHAHPNREHSDPDIDLPFFAFTEEKARDARTKGNPLTRLVVANQAALYFPLLTFTIFSMRVTSWRFLLRNRDKFAAYWPSWLTCTLHYAAYFGFLFAVMPPANVAVFTVVNYMALGVYLGSIFAPNHKGMPIVAQDAKIDYLREQVLTSRNIRAGLMTDFICGGLNFQIEHHLFPTMPRHNLRKANDIVKRFCKEKNIDYYETSFVRSVYEILRHLREMTLLYRAAA